METTINQIKFIGGGLTGLLLFTFGGADGLLMALMALIVIDFVTGCFKAIYNKTVDSKVFFKGGIKKVGILMIVSVANIVDNTLGFEGVFRNATIIYYISNEGISMLENWGELGLPLPSKLKNVLVQLRNDGDKGKEKD